MKKLILVLLLVTICFLVACSSVKAETPIIATSTANPEIQAISKAFRIAGVSGDLVGYDKVDICYIVQWTDGKSIYQTVYADGLLIGAIKQMELPDNSEINP